MGSEMCIRDSFNQFGTTVLIASHDIDLIRQMKFPMISLNKGTIESNQLIDSGRLELAV